MHDGRLEAAKIEEASRIRPRGNAATGEGIGDTPLGWSVSELAAAAERLCTAGAMNLPEVLALLH